MEDEGIGRAKAPMVEEGGSVVLKRLREDEKEDSKEIQITNSAPASSSAASGTKADKRPCVADSSPNAAAGTKAEVEGGKSYFRPSVENGWTWVPCSQDVFYGPWLPVEEEEEEEYFDDSDCIYGMKDGHYVVVGYAPKPPRLSPAVYDPEKDDPYGVTYEMYCRRRAELNGRHVSLDDPLYTERITTLGHPWPFLAGIKSGALFNLTEADMSAAKASAAAAADGSDSSAAAAAAASTGNNY